MREGGQVNFGLLDKLSEVFKREGFLAAWEERTFPVIGHSNVIFYDLFLELLNDLSCGIWNLVFSEEQTEIDRLALVSHLMESLGK